jgi:dimethylhistidine N-methyltransferase
LTTAAAQGLLSFETAAAIREGLGSRPRRLPFECFYDDVGSALFDAITLLPEYGVTRAERRLLRANRAAIVSRLNVPVEVVELGSGSGRTTRTLLESLARRGPVRYDPVDISAGALAECERQLAQVPGLTVRPFEGTHEEGLAAAVARRPPGRALLVLFLGSNIGNLDPAQARLFLCRVRARLRAGDFLLVGADLVKPEAQLQLAYDDPAGVTAAFNRNALARLNRELQANFDLAAFRHCARFDAQASRVEMHLVAERAMAVRIPPLGLELRIEGGESIWTESSYKFRPGELAELAETCGYARVDAWTDVEWPFSLDLLVAAGTIRADRRVEVAP